MKLVYEDEYGAYSGVRAEFLKKFVSKEINPNFEVYDSQDGNNRFIAVKSSRVPDDEDLALCRYGMDFNRAKPMPEEALQYKAKLTHDYQKMGDIAFAAGSEEEYVKKSAAWDNFYSYIWGLAPQTVWAVPHSGSVNRASDDIIPFPKLWIDNNTAGIAARCAYQDRSRASQRIMIYVHATGLLGAVVNLGDYGVLNGEKMNTATKKIEIKYHKRAQALSDDFKQDFCRKATDILKHIYKRRGTLNPEELNRISRDDSASVILPMKALKFYGQEIKKFTLEEFDKAMCNLGSIDVHVISINYLYPARHVSELLKLPEKIRQGLMHSALNIECAKYYAAKDHTLVSDIILDVKHELFD